MGLSKPIVLDPRARLDDLDPGQTMEMLQPSHITWTSCPDTEKATVSFRSEERPDAKRLHRIEFLLQVICQLTLYQILAKIYRFPYPDGARLDADHVSTTQ